MQEKTFSNAIAASEQRSIGLTARVSTPLNSAIHGITSAARQHWPEYLMEMGGMMIFIVTTCSLGALLFYPTAPVAQAIHDATLRRIAFGAAIAFTVMAFIYSPWGQQSGAHLNPSITITFLRLKKISLWDSCCYVLAQTLGVVLGITLVRALLGINIAQTAVSYLVTLPQTEGFFHAFLKEVWMAALLMTVVLYLTNHPDFFKYGGIAVGLLGGFFASSAMPMFNPLHANAGAKNLWSGGSIYLTAPLLGMLIAAELYLIWKGDGGVYCAKINHDNHKRCIFNCKFGELLDQSQSSSGIQHQT